MSASPEAFNHWKSRAKIWFGHSGPLILLQATSLGLWLLQAHRHAQPHSEPCFLKQCEKHGKIEKIRLPMPRSPGFNVHLPSVLVAQLLLLWTTVYPSTKACQISSVSSAASRLLPRWHVAFAWLLLMVNLSGFHCLMTLTIFSWSFLLSALCRRPYWQLL